MRAPARIGMAARAAFALHFSPRQSEWSTTRRGRRRRSAPTGSPAGLGPVAPGSSGAAPGAPIMALSDTARRILA